MPKNSNKDNSQFTINNSQLVEIFEDAELDEKVVCRDFRHTTQHGAIEGKTQDKGVKYYNLKSLDYTNFININ